MNKNVLWVVAGAVLLCCALVCCIGAVGFGYYSFNATEESVGATELPPAGADPQAAEAPAAEVPLACPASMQEVIDAVQYSVYEDSGASDVEEPDSYNLVTYTVNGDQIGDPQYEDSPSQYSTQQDDTDSHQLAWDLFAQLIPADYRAVVSEYVVFSDGPSNVLAAVEQSYTDPALWMVEVDNADLDDTDNLYFTLIHEFGHLLTLGPSQVPPDVEVYNNPDDTDLYDSKVAACPNYFPGEGCSLPDSYINTFYDRFWTGLVDEWQPIDDLGYTDDLDGYYDELYTFYENHQDEFVDDYAATNPSEDMAETFAYFIFAPKPAGDTVAEQKVLFFYEYPELVQLRAEILQNFCQIDQ